MKALQPGRYKHYKGNYYQVLGVARHSETEEELVVYKPLYGESHDTDDNLWVRPKSMFIEQVEVDGVQIPRFSFIEL